MSFYSVIPAVAPIGEPEYEQNVPGPRAGSRDIQINSKT
jgi:hypothetical protein